MIESEVLEARVGDVHVTPEQIADVNLGTYGPDDYVLNMGRQLEAQVVTNNSVRVFDGVMVYGGIRDNISVNKYYDIPIDNGMQGTNRNDIIVRRYVKEEGTNRARAVFAVVKGEPVEGAAIDPDITKTDLRAGALTHDMLLHRVKIEGLNIIAVEPLYDILYNADEIKQKIDSLNSNLSELIIKRSASNKVNVSAGAQSYTYITVSLPAGYSVLSVSAVAAHSTTLCGTASISGDRVYIPYSATTAQVPETFSAEIVLLKTP